MSTVWKVAVGLVVVLMLPVAAYAVGGATAPPPGPAPRPDIRITDTPSTHPRPSRRGPRPVMTRRRVMTVRTEA